VELSGSGRRSLSLWGMKAVKPGCVGGRAPGVDGACHLCSECRCWERRVCRGGCLWVSRETGACGGAGVVEGAMRRQPWAMGWRHDMVGVRVLVAVSPVTVAGSVGG
jgi:hypothetical protein